MSEFSDVIPFWIVDIDYPEGSLVIKEGMICRYWRYPKTGELVWLSVENCHQYDMFVQVRGSLNE